MLSDLNAFCLFLSLACAGKCDAKIIHTLFTTVTLSCSYSAISVSAPVVKTSETIDLTTFTRPTITCISAFPTKR